MYDYFRPWVGWFTYRWFLIWNPVARASGIMLRMHQEFYCVYSGILLRMRQEFLRVLLRICLEILRLYVRNPITHAKGTPKRVRRRQELLCVYVKNPAAHMRQELRRVYARNPRMRASGTPKR
jgi:hypothetical protein